MSFPKRPPASLARLVPSVLGAFAACAVACRSKPPPRTEPSARPSAMASASARPEGASFGCQPAGKEAGLVVGNAGPVRKAPDDDDDDDDPELPFSTEIGSAVALTGAFAVSGLVAREGGTDAFVAFVPFDAKPGRTLVLGAVHGDAGPPLVAAEGERVLVAVENTDAGGKTVELFALSPSSERPERGVELTDVVGDDGVGFAVSGKNAVLVRGTRKGQKTMLRSTSVSVAAPATAGPSADLAGTSDAESPVVRARPGGFWLAWIAQESARDAGPPEADASPEETRIVDPSPRVLMVSLLHADGSADGAPRAVSGASAHVVAFDAATLADGALALAWREDDAVPGVETGGSELARVTPDGAVVRGRAADEALSAGAPALVRESLPSGRTFLLVPGEDDRLRLALVAPSAVESSVFVVSDAWRGADILSAAPGSGARPGSVRFLLSRAKNRAVELSIAECRGNIGK